VDALKLQQQAPTEAFLKATKQCSVYLFKFGLFAYSI
jgi:hypothetical protein